jgi:hypothetical protein
MSDKDNKPSVKVEFSEDLKKLLKFLEGENSYVAFELLWMMEKDAKYHNGLKVSKVDISKDNWNFDVTLPNQKGIVTKVQMKVSKFVKYFLGSVVTDKEIFEFTKQYNDLKNGKKYETEPIGDLINVGEFKYNPKDVRSTFLSMVTKTYPYGNEDQVLKFLPQNLKRDKVGNYYFIIGDKPEVMFTSHLDTADRTQDKVVLYSSIENDNEYIFTDGGTILGADDKAGVTVMLYMMAHNVPGLYYFFIGEERGGIGSSALSSVYDSVDYLKDVRMCVSFDRRNYHSVITEQLGRRCCSDEFAKGLCDEYNKNGLSLSLDPTGVYTDSASFIDDISECTNVSVGYMHEHTGEEYQNMTYLISLCEASVKVNWNNLKSYRKVGINQEIMTKNKPFIDDVKKTLFGCEVKFAGYEGNVFLRMDLDEPDIDVIYDDLQLITVLLSKHKMDPDVTFSDTHLKIELLP